MTHKLRFDPYAFKSTTIEGIPVYYNHFDFAPCIHIRFHLGYGAIHDAAGKEGTAHFLEHMLFDGSSTFEDEKATDLFSKQLMFGSLNAHTSLFELVLKGKCLPENLKTVLEGMISMLVNPTLSAKSFDHEKKVITQEAWQYFLNNAHIEYMKKRRANRLYELPDRMRIISALGWPETVNALALEDITSAHKKNFIKENVTFYIAGNIEGVGGAQGLEQICSELFKTIPSGTKARDPFIPTHISKPKVACFDNSYSTAGLSNRKTSDVSIYKDWPRINKKAGQKNTQEENYHLSVLSLTTSIMSSLLYEKLRTENSWCYSAGARFGVNPDTIYFNMGAEVNPDHVDDTVKTMFQILEDLKEGKHRDKFDQNKILLVESTLAAERVTKDIIDSTMEVTTTANEIIPLQDLLEEFDRITFDDVRNLARDFLSKETMFTEILRPNKQGWLKKLFTK